MADQATPDVMHGEGLFARLPGWVVDTLTNEQKAAIYEAADQSKWSTHPVNIRISIPFVRRRFYLTLVGGEEKRSAERRAHDRHRYPLRTAANIFFFVGAAVLFYAAALFVVAINSALIEF